MGTELQFAPCETLLIGFRGNRDCIIEAIALCRRYDGKVISREGDVMIIEVSGGPDVLDELLAHLPKQGVTHLFRSGLADTGLRLDISSQESFCSS